MKTALLLEKLEGQLATLRQRCAPVAQFATLSARFDRHLFQTRATTLQACLDESGDNLAALRHAVEQQQLPQVAWLAEHLAAQLEARNQILNIALEHTSICEFYYYPLIRTCVIPRRTCEYYHCSERYEQMPDSFLDSFVVPSCHAACREMYEAIHNGLGTANADTLRLLVPGIYVNRYLDGRRAARLCCGYH